MNIEEKIALLTGTDTKAGCGVLNELIKESETSNSLYEYFDQFVKMIKNKSNSYIRTRGLRLIAFNAKWDTENKVNLIIGEYLKHIEDEKPITSRQCIQDTVRIARYKPELVETILNALENYNRVYQDSMQSLVYRDRKKAIQQIQQENW